MREEGSIKAALYWFDSVCRGERVAYIYAVATAKASRGRGLCRALLEDTHRHLKSLGYAFALLVPGEAALFDFYGRLGYQSATSLEEIRLQADSSSLALRPLSSAAYAEKRRLLLPEGSVLQEKEGLAFLADSTAFYEGEGFLLAARREGDVLFGVELLGEASVAPSILASLGCARGVFRTVGNGRPFSMWYPLKDGLCPPRHFGFAFD